MTDFPLSFNDLIDDPPETPDPITGGGTVLFE